MVFVFLFMMVLLSLWGVSVDVPQTDVRRQIDTEILPTYILDVDMYGRLETAYMHNEHDSQYTDLSRAMQFFLILLSFLFALLNERYGEQLRQTDKRPPVIAAKLETSILSHSLGSNAPPLF